MQGAGDCLRRRARDPKHLHTRCCYSTPACSPWARAETSLGAMADTLHPRITLPSVGSTSAMARLDVPVNMPTSSTVLAFVRRTRERRKDPSSLPAQHSFFCLNCVFFCREWGQTGRGAAWHPYPKRMHEPVPAAIRSMVS